MQIKKLQVEKENSTASMQLRPMIDSDCEYEPESDDELLDAYTDNQRFVLNLNNSICFFKPFHFFLNLKNKLLKIKKIIFF